VRCPLYLQQCRLWSCATSVVCGNLKLRIAESRPPSPSGTYTQFMMRARFVLSSTFLPIFILYFTFTFIFFNSTLPHPLSLSFSTVFSFSFLHSATVLLDAKAAAQFKIKGRVSLISWMGEWRGFGKRIQPGYLVHGESSHRFLCPCLDPSSSDILGLLQPLSKAPRLKLVSFFFPAASMFTSASSCVRNPPPLRCGGKGCALQL